MSNNIIDFSKGGYFYTTPEKSEFVKELKKILKRLDIGYNDVCCADSYCPAESPCGGGGTNTVLQEFIEEQSSVAINVIQQFY